MAVLSKPLAATGKPLRWMEMRVHVDTVGLLPEGHASCMSSCVLLPFLYVHRVYYDLVTAVSVLIIMCCI